VDDPAEADLFIDDIIDSGDTMRRWCDEYPGSPSSP
jgi:hypoxanthine-guanine phosphoribosyltransferase